jgi:precorrin-3B methylase
MVIIGSSTTRRFAKVEGEVEWVYTPRSYPGAAP